MNKALATDLDGTLIPLDDNENNRNDLQQLKELAARSTFDLMFVTGRHFELVADAMEAYRLPLPGWIICDVGTTLLHWSEEEDFRRVDEYREELSSIVETFPLEQMRESLEDVPELRLQEPEKQGEFKLSYYCEASDLEQATGKIQDRIEQHGAPYSLISSTDPFENVGLLDLLPKKVSKAYALDWWVHFTNHDREQVIFAGDSGNDTAALTAGYRAIVVGNAKESVKAEVRAAHEQQGTLDRLYLAENFATSGVLEGCRHFGLC
jgi:HAD superfamily hydrolase (TIGR01484 family)